MLQLHHLETSRSSRVIWLLEALGLEYELITHKRGPNMRALPDLAAVHPLGKAPVIIDGGLVMAESGTILRYIAERYGNGRFVPPAGTLAHASHDEWLDYAESSLMLPGMITMLGFHFGGLPPAFEAFAAPEMEKALDYLTAGVGNKSFLMGDELTLADMQMSYCLAMLEVLGKLKDRPTLAAYWQRLQDQPSFKRTVEIGGPLVPRS